MAFYEEEDVYKCTIHPSSKRRRCNGICPLCLIDRLEALCPDCAHLRPCTCSSSSCSSRSSNSSFYILDISSSSARISTLIDTEPAFSRRSSSAFPFFRSARFPSTDPAPPPPQTTSFWSVFRRRKSPVEKISRSKSVAYGSEPVKAKGWYFPSPMNVFRHSKASKVAHERSPLHRG
ncbi:uncharacterized protein LOC141644277 [Silene latifolia]|uniref:uncharacterized protein LOC141644277 n=1 Tax=Silene latifolia TaxID=37657 RepID=UPI003D781BF3